MVKAISKNQEAINTDLNVAIEERSKKILERFEHVILSGVKNSKLVAILEDVKSYWSSPKSPYRDLIRPALVSFSCEAVGGEPELANDAGLMFTLASSGFGIHDDILDRSTHM